MSLLTLPPELLAIITSFLPPADISTLHRTSRRLHALVTPILSSIASHPTNVIPALSLALALRSPRAFLSLSYPLTLHTPFGPLHTTPALPSASTLSTILHHGPNLTIQTSGYFAPPLERAVRSVHPWLVARLLSAGASVSAVNKDQYLLLHYAAGINASEPIVQLLLSAGADKNALDGRGRTPLMHAIVYRQHGIAGLLLHAGAVLGEEGEKWADTWTGWGAYGEFLTRLDKAYVDGEGRGVLLQAVAWRRVSAEVVKAVLKGGGDVAEVDRRGRGVVSVCVEWADRGREEVLEVLVGAGADVDARDAEGRTPLHEVVERGVCGGMMEENWRGPLTQEENRWWPVVGWLVRLGACVDVEDARGRTVWDIVREKWAPGRAEQLEEMVAVREGRAVERDLDSPGHVQTAEDPARRAEIDEAIRRIVEGRFNLDQCWDSEAKTRAMDDWVETAKRMKRESQRGWFGAVEKYTFGLFKG